MLPCLVILSRPGPTRSPFERLTRIGPSLAAGHVPAHVTCPPTRHSHPGPAVTRPGPRSHHGCTSTPGPHPHHELPSMPPSVGPSVMPAHTDPLASPQGSLASSQAICVFASRRVHLWRLYHSDCTLVTARYAALPGAPQSPGPHLHCRCDRPGTSPPRPRMPHAATARGPHLPGLACTVRHRDPGISHPGPASLSPPF